MAELQRKPRLRQLNVRFTEPLINAVGEAIAVDFKATTSEFMRHAAEEYVERHYPKIYKKYRRGAE